MGLMVNPSEPVALVPADHIGRPEAERRTYYLRVPTVADRAKYKHACQVAGARRHDNYDLVEALADGVRALLPDDADAELRADLLAVVDAHRERMDGFRARIVSGELSSDADPVGVLEAWAEASAPTRALKEVELIVARDYARYSVMTADNAVYDEVVGMVAARLFLVGWDNGPAAFRLRADRTAPDDLLSLIPTAHLVEIGRRIGRMLDPSEEKKSG